MNIGTDVNLKFVAALYYVVTVVLQGSVNCNDDIEFKLVEEVVSIYNENFTTPESREPYFIKVHRCITTWGFNPVQGKLSCWAFPKNQTEIEIVVQDINNNNKFYKYIVFNHTNCTYDERNCDLGPEKQHNISHEVNQIEFNEKYPKNPDNLRNCNASSFCSKPQPRYNPTSHSDGLVAPGQNYQLYHQCLPGCSRTTKKESRNVTLKSGTTKPIMVETDTACAPYGASPLNSRVIMRESPVTESKSVSENGLLIYIGSSKVFLAALVLSLVLLSILIVDFNLCHRKKGLFYTLWSCKKDTADKNCPGCSKRPREVIDHEIV